MMTATAGLIISRGSAHGAMMVRGSSDVLAAGGWRHHERGVL